MTFNDPNSPRPGAPAPRRFYREAIRDGLSKPSDPASFKRAAHFGTNFRDLAADLTSEAVHSNTDFTMASAGNAIYVMRKAVEKALLVGRMQGLSYARHHISRDRDAKNAIDLKMADLSGRFPLPHRSYVPGCTCADCDPIDINKAHP